MAPTPLDRLLQSRNAILGFAGVIVGVSAWAILRDAPILSGTDEPWGDVDEWTIDELRGWLCARNVEPSADLSREDLLEIVKTAKGAPPPVETRR